MTLIVATKMLDPAPTSVQLIVMPFRSLVTADIVVNIDVISLDLSAKYLATLKE